MATSTSTWSNVTKKPPAMRVDPSDGKAYPFASFQEVYGKDADRLWRLAGGSHGGASSYPASRYSRFDLVPGNQNTTTKEPMLRPPDMRLVTAMASIAMGRRVI